MPSVAAKSLENTKASEANTEQSENDSQVEKETATFDSSSMSKKRSYNQLAIAIVGVILVIGVG